MCACINEWPILILWFLISYENLACMMTMSLDEEENENNDVAEEDVPFLIQ